MIINEPLKNIKSMQYFMRGQAGATSNGSVELCLYLSNVVCVNIQWFNLVIQPNQFTCNIFQ